MISSIFNWLSNAINLSSPFALIASFIWGVLSILLSPCHLSSIPLIVGFIDSEGNLSVRRAFFLSSLFSIGILITIIVVGIVTGLIGRILGDIGPYGNYIVAIILIIVGLYLLEVVNIPFFSQSNQNVLKIRGLLASFLLGLIFGLGVGPCTFAYMMPVLGVVFKIASTNFVYAISLILFYAIGHCSVIIFAGTFAGFVQTYLNWNEKSKCIIILKKICGILVIFSGIYLIFKS